MIASGRQAELMDRIYSAYSAYRDRNELVIVEGTSVGASRAAQRPCQPARPSAAAGTGSSKAAAWPPRC
jgi:hypothetical protein